MKSLETFHAHFILRSLRQRKFVLGVLLLAVATSVLFYVNSLEASTSASVQERWIEDFGELFKGRRPTVQKVVDHGPCPKEMWLLRNAGRLGNRFLEYIGARVVATTQNRELWIIGELNNIFARYFTGNTATVISEGYLSTCNVSWNTIHHSYFVNMERFLKPIEYSRAKVIGFPLSLTPLTWSIVFRHRQLLLSEFQFKESFAAQVRARIEEVTKGRNYSTLIGIHVRRTDFYQHMIGMYGKAKTADKGYFDRAKAIYRERYGNPLFMVISDDIPWCDEHLKASDVVFPGSGNQDDPGWDLAIMASCQHIILTYGTFGITAAFFSGGDVIIADNFTERPNELNERLRASNLTNWTWLSVGR